ncbi:hypothetical protein POVWA1_050010 [Plasmodium ovale wallikeri]|uniref:Uncharacterized protein n=1 Tax=Plasmodium ovale wallikeri TaxID=864142 RepID=A0A1A8ZKR7_PLAOA|nr:hypothetical protein POVWA1_050010 [Plasmodium ovale wallikeri]
MAKDMTPDTFLCKIFKWTIRKLSITPFFKWKNSLPLFLTPYIGNLHVLVKSRRLKNETANIGEKALTKYSHGSCIHVVEMGKQMSWELTTFKKKKKKKKKKTKTNHFVTVPSAPPQPRHSSFRLYTMVQSDYTLK